MTKIQKIKSALSGTAAMAMTRVNGDLGHEIHADELEAMGKGIEEHEEGGDDHGEE